MTKYFSQDTPLAGLERMMMSVPGFQKRGGGMMVLCRFHYKKEDVDCTYCRSYMRHTCQESVCPYIPERLEAGTIGYQELAERCLRMAGHQKLWKRASSLSKGNTLPLALEPAHRHRLSEWPEAGTASICPQKLAAVYLLSSRIGLWRRVLPHISHGRIDFSSVSLRGIDPRDYPVYRAAKGLYCGKLLITSAELADEEQVSSEAFGDILNAMLIARYGKTIIPEDYRGHIENMRDSFFVLDGGAAELDGQMENGDSLDRTRVKAIFYALYFGEEQPSQRAHKQYLDCFVTYEERTRTVTEADDAGNEVEVEETYTVAVPIRDLSVVYENIRSKMGTEITAEDQANATEIYYRILCGGPAPTYGSEFDIWSDGLPLSDAPFIGADGFCSPIGESWRSVVTSEFGWRKDPFTGKGAGHTGIDLGMPKGTPIRAALTGTVYLVRYSTTGYGYHVMIDHGGGFVTLYAHCSKLLVAEGQQVQAGDIIAEVGSTGRSTGNHLHFEVRINGEKQNPRSYLP